MQRDEFIFKLYLTDILHTAHKSEKSIHIKLRNCVVRLTQYLMKVSIYIIEIKLYLFYKKMQLIAYKKLYLN